MSGERLSPARPDGGATASYGPRVPWRLIVGVVVVGVAGVVAWQVQSSLRLSALKDQVVTAHEQFAEAEDQHKAFRRRIEALTKSALVSDPPEPFADERLDLSHLYESEGVYLRIPNSVGSDLEQLEAAALAMAGDAVPRCLGVGPLSLRSFYESGQFLSPRYRDRIRNTQDEFVVEALAGETERRGMQYAATTAAAARADYFLLVIERGDTPRSGPVDVFLWDLDADEDDPIMLRARTSPKGMLIPARIAVGDAPRARRAPLRDSPVADDCSIVAQIKVLTGNAAEDVHSTP